MLVIRAWLLSAIAWIAFAGAQQAPAPQSSHWGQSRSPYSYYPTDDTVEWTSVLITGRSVSEQASCPNAAGIATVQMTAQDLPAAFANGPVLCKFVPWNTFQRLRNGTRQFEGRVTLVNSSEALASLVRVMHSAEASSAQQRVTAGPRNAWKTNEFSVTCPFKAALGDVAVVLVSKLEVYADQDVLLLTLGSTQLRGSAVYGIAPEVGPLNGGTAVELEGQGLNETATCSFGKATYVQTVPAQISEAGNATCMAPEWPAIISNSTNGTVVNLNVTLGGCQYNFTYGYYAAPLVSGVQPESGPRYGSFPLTVFLEDSLDSVSHGKGHLQLRPMLKMEGAQPDGSDLLLAANVSADRRSLVALTPASQNPLSAGDHPLKLSLNGQFSEKKQPDIVVSVQGPAISMGLPYVHAAADAGSVEVPVMLSGSNMLPVSASFSVSQRMLSQDGTLQIGLPPAEVSAAVQDSSLQWQPGQNGTTNLSVPLGAMGDALHQGALLLRLSTVTNADLSIEHATALISGLPQENLTVDFDMQPDQVAYHREAVVIPFAVTSPALRVPAAVPYTLQSLTGEDLTEYIPKEYMEGILEWDQQPGTELNLTIPVNWTAIPPQAEYRLGVLFGEAWSAVLGGGANETAVHIFGVLPDQCPPGTYRSNATQPTGVSKQRGGQRVQLRGIIVHGQNGTVYDLSSAFNPDVDEYGASVPPAFVNGSLCILPGNDALAVQVYAPDGSALQHGRGIWGVGATHNRRSLAQAAGVACDRANAYTGELSLTGCVPSLRASAVSAPAAAFEGLPPAAEMAGVAAMVSSNTSAAVDSLCRQHTWPLNLEPGQNQFTIEVTSPQASEDHLDDAERLRPAYFSGAPPDRDYSSDLTPAHGPSTALWNPKPYASMAAADSPAPSSDQGEEDNVTDIYWLSIVRLAEAEHAELACLNATLSSKHSMAVCGAVAPPLSSAANVTGAACVPGTPMWLNVSHDVDWVSLRPELRWPGVTGLRVEVNGQVLSQGGDVAADQLEDTTAETHIRASADFLPVAFVLGLAPGRATEVPIVIVAEDGVTSLRYYLNIFRAVPPAGSGRDFSASAWPLGDDASSGIAGSPAASLDLLHSAGSAGDDWEGMPSVMPSAAMSARTARQPGWPTPPSQQPWCSTCPAGWASTTTDASGCQMCMPGSFAASPQSPECTPCGNGTYAYSWGSTHCNHCIIGTYAPREGSRLCFMCPSNTTNLEDGSSDCPTALQPGTNTSARYAVIVSFGVYLNGTSLDDIAQKVGVNASSQDVLQHLIKADTASAFNISVGDVNVTGISQVSRRVLYVNVTATLGVNVPPNASPDDVRSALDVTNLSADDPIAMLAANPDKFFGRTTKALDVTAETDGRSPERTEYRPFGSGSALGQAWPAIGAVLLLLAICGGCFAWHWHRRSRRLQRICDAVLERCHRCRRGSSRWRTTAHISTNGDASNVALSSPGLTVRGKPASFIRMQDAEPMYKESVYSDGQARSL